MTLKIIGAGLGRTGTLSLTMALEQLDFGPCHHMRDVFGNMVEQVPLWSAAVNGKPDWPTIFKGYASAVDWPTASFYRELHEVYPQAKVILTLRSPESWYESYSATIRELVADRERLPTTMHDWHAMSNSVKALVGISGKMDKPSLMQAFNAHNETVKQTIPASQLLIFQVKDGWAPLCEFLAVPVPEGDFPRSNDSTTFWDNKPFRP
jgi:Sulfotransferase domain